MDERIMEYFKFDAADLSENRSGALTEKQRTRLTAELQSARAKKTLMAYGVFFLAALGVLVAVGIWFVPAAGFGMRIGFTIGFGLIWSAVYIFMGMIFLPSPLYTDLKLASETGRVNIVRVESHNSTNRSASSRFDLYIGNRRFVADHHIGKILIQGDEYTVYYLPQSQKIVSVELISSGK